MFRFSIRELILVTLVVAMGAGWLAERMGHKDINDAVEFMEKEHTNEIANLNGELESFGLEIRHVGWHGRHVVKIKPRPSTGKP
jgi:hypothetical protein